MTIAIWKLISLILSASVAKATTELGQIRMNLNIIVGINSDNYLETVVPALRQLVDSLNKDENQTSVSLITYGADVEYEPFLTDSETFGERLLKAKPEPRQNPSVLHKALERASAELTTNSSSNQSDARLVTLVIVPVPPKDSENNLEYGNGREAAENLRNRGLLYIIYYDLYSEIEQKSILYMIDLTGSYDRFFYQKDTGLNSTLMTSFKQQLMTDLCDVRTRICRYESEKRANCTAVWHWSSVYTNQCPKVKKIKQQPNQCNVTECETECDTRWPWQKQSRCECETPTLPRIGGNPLPEFLDYCPTERNCTNQCTTTTTTTPTSSTRGQTSARIKRKTAAAIELTEKPKIIGDHSNEMAPDKLIDGATVPSSVPSWAVVGIASSSFVMMGLIGLGVVVVYNACQDEKPIRLSKRIR